MTNSAIAPPASSVSTVAPTSKGAPSHAPTMASSLTSPAPRARSRYSGMNSARPAPTPSSDCTTPMLPHGEAKSPSPAGAMACTARAISVPLATSAFGMRRVRTSITVAASSRAISAPAQRRAGPWMVWKDMGSCAAPAAPARPAWLGARASGHEPADSDGRGRHAVAETSEQPVEAGAEQRGADDDRDGDQRGDEAVLDGGGAVLVTDEGTNGLDKFHDELRSLSVLARPALAARLGPGLVRASCSGDQRADGGGRRGHTVAETSEEPVQAGA